MHTNWRTKIWSPNWTFTGNVFLVGVIPRIQKHSCAFSCWGKKYGEEEWMENLIIDHKEKIIYKKKQITLLLFPCVWPSGASIETPQRYSTGSCTLKSEGKSDARLTFYGPPVRGKELKCRWIVSDKTEDMIIFSPEATIARHISVSFLLKEKLSENCWTSMLIGAISALHH